MCFDLTPFLPLYFDPAFPQELTVLSMNLPVFPLQNYVKAMRLFVGEPVWTAYNRPADHFPAREQYQQFLAQAVQ